MILITGATGKIGSELIKNLVKAKAPIRALVRDPHKASSLEGLGIEIVFGDLGKPETLQAAIAGVESAFLLPANGPQQAEQGHHFIEQAKQAQVRHVVKLSNFAPDLNSPNANARRHAQTNQELIESGIAYTLLRPNFFMQNLLMFAKTIQEKDEFYLPSGNATVGMVDVRDIAAVAAVALTTSGHTGKDYVLTGPAAVSFYQVADELSDATGRTIRYVPLSPDDFKRYLLNQGQSDDTAEALTQTYKGVGEGRNTLVTNTVAEVALKQPIPFAQFAQDYVSSFQSNAGKL